MRVTPDDSFNQALERNVHPADWVHPTPAGRYNLVAIGGGTAGLIAAVGTARLGGRVALVERHLLGGDCLNYGCVPSKALLAAARAAYAARRAGEFGAPSVEGPVDFARVMERMRRLRAEISRHDSAERMQKLGIDLFLGDARFTSADSLDVGGTRLPFHRAVIATGGRPSVPDIPGLSDAGYLTNETIFSLTELPRRLGVFGVGPIGCELAQAFARFGSQVSLIGRRPQLMPKEDPAAGAVLLAQFQREGISCHLNTAITAVEQGPTGKTLVLQREGVTQRSEVDALLVATGRTPNLEELGLKAAGIAHTPSGVTVDDFLRTTNRRVYAAGDICGRAQFTHAADAMSRIALRNALFFGRARLSELVIPRTTYTDPEIAHVGLTPAEAAAAMLPIDTYRCELAEVDRAVLEGETAGFAAVHTRRGSGQIVGGTIVATHAGEMIGELTLLLTHKLSLGKLAETIHCYPTRVEVLKRIGDQYLGTRLTPVVGRLLKWILTLRRDWNW